MLFVHGFPELWYSWRHQLTAFQDDYEVAAFDMRGYGQSDKPQVGDLACCLGAKLWAEPPTLGLTLFEAQGRSLSARGVMLAL